MKFGINTTSVSLKMCKFHKAKMNGEIFTLIQQAKFHCYSQLIACSCISYQLVTFNLLKNSHSSCKKGATKSGRPTQDGQGEKLVKSRWWPRNDCDCWSMAIFLLTAIQVICVLITASIGIRTKFT